MPIRTTLIKLSMPTSFNTEVMPRPLIIIAFTADIYHFAGTISESHCSGTGMFSMGKIIPDSNMTGSISPIPEINMAACCEFVIVETSNPRANDKNIYSNETATKLIKLPATGTFSTNTDNNMMVAKFTQDKTK